MRANLNNLSPRTWALLAVSVLAAAYPVVTIVVPAVIHAMVPQVVRNVLGLL